MGIAYAFLRLDYCIWIQGMYGEYKPRSLLGPREELRRDMLAMMVQERRKTLVVVYLVDGERVF
jgi:hypothetical protein